jgi:hypothetical protein
MDVKELRSLLKRAETLFRRAGAPLQARALQDFNEVLERTDGRKSVDEYVETASTVLKQADVVALSADEITAELDRLKTDATAFEALMRKLQQRQVSKEKAIAVAARYTGSPAAAWKSKAAALKAIKSRFDDRAYQADKDRLDEKVTPW